MKKILVVDDEVELAELLSVQMQMQGFLVEVAHNGTEALEKCKNQKYDLVISDVRMPNGDGMFLLDSLKGLGDYQPPVILMSGFTDLTKQEILQRGAKAFLNKPSELKDIIPTAKKLNLL